MGNSNKSFRALEADPYYKVPEIRYPSSGLGEDWYKRHEVFQSYEGVSEKSQVLNPLGSFDKIKNGKYDPDLQKTLKSRASEIKFLYDNSKKYLSKKEQAKIIDFIKNAEAYQKAAERLEARWNAGFRQHNESVRSWPLEKSFIQVCPKNVYGAKIDTWESSRGNSWKSSRGGGTIYCPTSYHALGHKKDVELGVRLLRAAASNLQAARKIIAQRRVYFGNKDFYDKYQETLEGTGQQPSIPKELFTPIKKAPPVKRGIKNFVREKGIQAPKSILEILKEKDVIDKILLEPLALNPTPPSPEEKFDDRLMEMIEAGVSPLDIIVRFIDKTKIEDSEASRVDQFSKQKFQTLESIEGNLSSEFQILEDYESVPVMVIRGSIQDAFTFAESPEIYLLEADTAYQQSGIESGIDSSPEITEEVTPIKKKSRNNTAMIAVGAIAVLFLLGRK